MHFITEKHYTRPCRYPVDYNMGMTCNYANKTKSSQEALLEDSKSKTFKRYVFLCLIV